MGADLLDRQTANRLAKICDKYRELDAAQREAEWEILVTELKAIQTPRRTN